jgi:hypothetical protein
MAIINLQKLIDPINNQLIALDKYHDSFESFHSVFINWMTKHNYHGQGFIPMLYRQLYESLTEYLPTVIISYVFQYFTVSAPIILYRDVNYFSNYVSLCNYMTTTLTEYCQKKKIYEPEPEKPNFVNIFMSQFVWSDEFIDIIQSADSSIMKEYKSLCDEKKDYDEQYKTEPALRVYEKYCKNRDSYMEFEKTRGRELAKLISLQHTHAQHAKNEIIKSREEYTKIMDEVYTECNQLQIRLSGFENPNDRYPRKEITEDFKNGSLLNYILVH